MSFSETSLRLFCGNPRTRRETIFASSTAPERRVAHIRQSRPRSCSQSNHRPCAEVSIAARKGRKHGSDIFSSFPDIANTMTSHLRRFVTSPLPIFEFAFASEARAPPPLAAAAKCLALCIKVYPHPLSPLITYMLNCIDHASWPQATI